MTTRPSDLPRWATTATGTDITEPDTTKKDTGFRKVAGTPEKPPYQDFNWLLNNIYQWLLHFSETNFGSNGGTDEILNNQAAAVDLEDASANTYTFAPATYGCVEIEAHVRVDATTPLRSLQTYTFIWNGSSFDVMQDEVGDTTGVELSLTAAGLLQYTSGNYAGYTAATCSWQARAFEL